jgi:hypothetical protein
MPARANVSIRNCYQRNNDFADDDGDDGLPYGDTSSY